MKPISHPEYFNSIQPLAQKIKALADQKPDLLVGISGLGGSGKTTLCRDLIKILGNQAERFNCDLFSQYGLKERNKRIETARQSKTDETLEAEENPKNWYDWHQIGAALKALKVSPSYVYDNGWNNETGEIDQKIILTRPDHAHSIMLVDCIYLLHSPVRNWFDLTIHVQCPFDVITKRGRVRAVNSGNPDFFEGRHLLIEKYDLPYFRTHAPNADWLYVRRENAPGR